MIARKYTLPYEDFREIELADTKECLERRSMFFNS
jgi:hypothetical protein